MQVIGSQLRRAVGLESSWTEHLSQLRKRGCFRGLEGRETGKRPKSLYWNRHKLVICVWKSMCYVYLRFIIEGEPCQWTNF